MPKSETAIAETPLPLIEEWATETEKQLTPLCSITKDTLTVAKDEPQNYKQLIQDLKNARTSEKKKRK